MTRDPRLGDFFRVHLGVIAIAILASLGWRSWVLTLSLMLGAGIIFANVGLMAKIANQILVRQNRIRLVALLIVKYLGVFAAIAGVIYLLPIHLIGFVCGLTTFAMATLIYAVKVAISQ